MAYVCISQILCTNVEVVNVVHTYLFTGYYMYIETSIPRVPGDNAKLNSPVLRFCENMCLKFFYHMYGATTGRLNVIINDTNTVFSAIGNKGTKWFEARITTSISGMFVVSNISMATRPAF